jgi:hypothetical protein
MPFVDPHPPFSGFTLHTPTSVTIPGRWGVLMLMYPPAAAAALEAERNCEFAQNSERKAP